MVRKTNHVVPNTDRRWDVKNQDSEFVVHKKNGKIQNLDSHVNDPFPPKDKK